VSIHFDEGPRPDVSGIETYFAAQQTTGVPTIASWLPFLQNITNNQSGVGSQNLAQCIQQQLVMDTHAINRGTKAEQFYMLANVRHPAVLVEGGFLTNKNEIEKLVDANYREQLAVAISDGILKYRDTITASGSDLDGANP
jgi:N-acetylmuramoyl-L-alanine amidase